MLSYIPCLLLLLLLAQDVLASTQSSTNVGISRPSLVTKAIESNSNLFYFGVASNMLKSKLLGRGINNTKIDIISFVPGVAKNHRLAFNMKGFVPLEPAMGGCEPCENMECHGALCEVTAENYEKIWKSEGGGQKRPGYEEIVVDVYPYGKTEAVKAVTLRAADFTRLRTDASPSRRYMDIIIAGAKELNLDKEYIKKLESVKTQRVCRPLKMMAFNHLFFLGVALKLNMRFVNQMINKILWAVYVRQNYPMKAIRALSQCMIMLVLLPSSLVGWFVRIMIHDIGKKPVPPMIRVLSAEMFSSPDDNSGSNSSSKEFKKAS